MTKVLRICLILSVCIVNGNGLCAYPCSRQNRVFSSFTDSFMSDFRTGDSTVFKSTVGNISYYFECWERSGPFFVLRRLVDGYYEYRCVKDTVFDTAYDVVVFFETNWVVFEYPPTICDVCNGTGYGDVRVFVAEGANCTIVVCPELGCNIPRLCPVTDPETQIQCTGCKPSESFDDGLCCNNTAI